MTDTITSHTRPDTCIRLIHEAAKEFMLDQAGFPGLSEDEVWTDLAASMLVDASERTAREVCRREIGYVPQSLEELWKQRKLAQSKKDRERAKERVLADRKAREEAERAAQRAELDAVRAARCPKCFTLPSAKGACLCV